MSKILSYGSLNLDYVYEVEHFVTPGETISSKNMILNCGGKGLNQTVAASRAGGCVFHAGKIGNNGATLKDFLLKENVNINYLRDSKLPNGHAIIQVDKTGQNSILLFAGSNQDQKEYEIDEALSYFEAGDYLILQNEINEIPYLIEKGRERGLNVVFNPSPITAQIKDYPINKVSLLILNEIEGFELSGEQDPYKIIEVLFNKYRCNILLTLGKKGAMYYDGLKITEHGIYNTTVVDTTAAGDTMNGFFIAMLSQGKSPSKALELASKASSIAVSRNGAAQSIPTINEVEKMNFK